MADPRAKDVDGNDIKEFSEAVIIGKCPNQWPIHIFEQEVHAVYWYEQQKKEGNNPRVWLAKLSSLKEMSYIPPVDGKLRVTE